MTQLDRMLRIIDPARQESLTPKEVDSIWAAVEQRIPEQADPGHAIHRTGTIHSLPISDLRTRKVLASGAAVVLLAAVGLWVGIGTSASSHGSGPSQALRSLNGAVDLSARTLETRGATHINMPTAHYIYAAGSSLSTSTSQALVFPVGSSLNSGQLSDLTLAAGVASTGAWTTTGATSTYSVTPSSAWQLTVQTGSALPSFVYQASTASCSTPGHGAIATFNAIDASTWSASFLTALGYSSSNFTAPIDNDNGWSCAGSYWDFSRSLVINHAASPTNFEFAYSPTSGALLSASGVFVSLGTSTTVPLASPSTAAHEYATHGNAGGTGSTQVPTVNVTLSSGTLQYGLYRLSSGALEYVPTYVFAGTCSSNQAFCEIYNFPESAVGSGS